MRANLYTALGALKIGLDILFKEEQVEVLQIQHLINDGLDQETEIFIHTDPCTPSFCKHCTMPECAFRTEVFRAKRLTAD